VTDKEKDTGKIITAVDAGGAIIPERDPGRACLVVIYGPELGRRCALSLEPFEIGRSSKCDLPIDQESISRQHVRIVFEQGAHMVSDLGSTNGTWVNEARVQKSALRDGDQLKVGRSILKYMSGDNIEASYHEEIYRLMTVDALTQVHNRRYFDEALEREFNRSVRYRRALSLVLFDIDHFKKVNDTYGHVAGDSVLRQLSGVIKPRLRQQDMVARVGGEEFAVLLPEVELHGAKIAAEKIRRLAESARFQVDTREFTCTVSLGVACFAPQLPTPVALYEEADKALYRAKQGGRNRVES
jgi:diguanylate cyclase (GGDEF)-like protein